MIAYDRTNWYRVCFAWRGTVLPHILGRVGLLTGFCLVVYGLDRLAWAQTGRQLGGLDPLGHSVLGVALSMLIVFRTNSAFNRFWEARSHWGMLVNTTRNLARMGAVYAGPADELARLLSAYVILVKEQLRDHPDVNVVRHLLPGRVLERLAGVRNAASVLAGSLSEWIAGRLQEGRLDPMLAARMESLVGVLLDSQGACEKIHKTPMPFVYAALIKQVLLLYLATLPFALVPKMHFVAPLVVAGVALGMLGIEEAGVEIEDPFGLEDNHLPQDAICEMIGRDVHDLTGASKG